MHVINQDEYLLRSCACTRFAGNMSICDKDQMVGYAKEASKIQLMGEDSLQQETGCLRKCERCAKGTVLFTSILILSLPFCMIHTQVCV